MFFGIGSLPLFLVGLPVVIGLLLEYNSNADAYTKYYTDKNKKRYEKNKKEWDDWLL